ncbi:hypothetical protein KGQ19_16340 [Catenulispora sp. NL8]|uniref:SMI1/KNR4 family protein n=1 Tax=Catenulispora pinistramenti TaxID=2705254 RepID=A0ABS5KQX3_9ACTN|nr:MULTISPECIES: hypothetical protein [Catenulispora]MBS2548437.1 hypothetical protein [Catenulispora pinistramenti]
MPGDWLERLTSQMPPRRADGGSPERRLGELASADELHMPSDYVRFVEAYGFGAVGDYLIVDRPALPPAEYLEEYESPYRAYSGNCGGVIYFATTADADDVFYLLNLHDGEGCVVVKRRHFYGAEEMWKKFDCGLLEFLVLTLDAQLPGGNPFSGTHLWGRDKPVKFVPSAY